MRKKLEFSMATTTEEIRTLGFSEKNKNWLISIGLMEEAERRAMAVKIADVARCGLDIEIYEDHTNYFLDSSIPLGITRSLKYGGIEDLRNV